VYPAVAPADVSMETDMMMMGPGGVLMMIAGGIAAILSLGLLASLIVLTWVWIARLRRDGAAPRSTGTA
jgi:type IV secretory pathway TrbD component